MRKVKINWKAFWIGNLALTIISVFRIIIVFNGGVGYGFDVLGALVGIKFIDYTFDEEVLIENKEKTDKNN